MDKITLDLKYPIEVANGAKIEKFALPRPKGKHLKKLPLDFLGAEKATIELLVPFLLVWLNIDLDIFDMIDGVDLFEIISKLELFLELSPGTGKK